MSKVAVVKVAAGEHCAGWKQIRNDREELYRKILGEDEPD